MFLDIDTLAMPTVFGATTSFRTQIEIIHDGGPLWATNTDPQILVVDDIAVFGGDLDVAPNRNIGLSQMRRDFVGPLLERRAVRLVADIADHEVGQMTKLVRQRVNQAVFAVDDLLRQLDAGKVLDFDTTCQLCCVSCVTCFHR